MTSASEVSDSALMPNLALKPAPVSDSALMPDLSLKPAPVPSSAVNSTPIFDPALKSAVASALSVVPSNARGRVGFGVTLIGTEVSVGWKPTPVFELGGYAKKLWGGGYTAGAQGAFIWCYVALLALGQITERE